jgi:hypothetical protein
MQVKYNDLGATEAALAGLESKHEVVQIAASRLLLVLLTGGNAKVQNTIHEVITKARSEGFVVALKEGIKSGRELVKAYSRIKLEVEEQQMMAVLTARLSMRKSQRGSGGKVSAGTLMTMRAMTKRAAQPLLHGVDVATGSFFMSATRLVEALTEGHHAPLQAYMSEQAVNKSSHNLLSEIVNVLEELQPACNFALENW